MKTRLKVTVLGILFPVILLMLYSFISTNEDSSHSNQTSIESVNVGSAISDVDQEAVDKLRNTLDYLSNLKRFSVETQNTLEDLDDLGHRLDYEIASKLVVRRPNKVQAERHGSFYSDKFYYDGASFTMYNYKENMYVTDAAPGTIEEMLHTARDTYGISAPLADLIYNNSFDLLIYQVNYAAVIGKEIIDKVKCDHLLFSRPGVDFQVWVAENGAPLIYKYVVTDTSTPELLGFTTVMHNWNTTSTLSDKEFNFVPPKGAKKIEFNSVE